MVEDIDKTEVHVWAVMDGHGGQVNVKPPVFPCFHFPLKFCADYCEEHLVPGLVTAIQKLKLLTSSLDTEKKLEPTQASRYRARVARANYLAQDRPDIQLATQVLCREMSEPTVRGWNGLKDSVGI